MKVMILLDMLSHLMIKAKKKKKKRLELLGKMVQCQNERSLVNKIFVSLWCLANDSLSSRDLTQKADLANNSTNVGQAIQSIHLYIILTKVINNNCIFF